MVKQKMLSSKVKKKNDKNKNVDNTKITCISTDHDKRTCKVMHTRYPLLANA